MPTKEFITIQSNMKRQGYQRPEMKVVELRQRCAILTVSDPQEKPAQKQDYESVEWE